MNWLNTQVGRAKAIVGGKDKHKEKSGPKGTLTNVDDQDKIIVSIAILREIVSFKSLQ